MAGIRFHLLAEVVRVPGILSSPRGKSRPVSAEQTCPICADDPMKARMVSEQTTGGFSGKQALIPDGDARHVRDTFCFLWP